MDLTSLTLKELKQKLDAEEITSLEVTQAYIDRIQKYDNEIGSFLAVDFENALLEAKKSDAKRKEKKPLGYLEGIPVAIKDNICTLGMKTTCSSKMLENFVPPYDATVIEKLKEAGCIILGKTNMDEFAMGGSTETSYFKKTKNPWNLKRVPGGSSGGSISAVAAEFVPFSLGSDTGGSVRQPASYCGIVGLKPTYGEVSRYGLIAFASSLDQIGPATKTVYDAGMVMNVIAGYDKKDSTSKNIEYTDFLSKIGEDISGMKIGVPKEFLMDNIDVEVRQKIQNVISILKEKGCIVDEISMDIAKNANAVYYIIACAEASSNLARYDGIRYGYRSDNYDNLIDMYKNSRSEGFGKEVKNRIMLGTYVLSSGYYDAYYKRAQQVRTLIMNEYEEIFKNYDLIITPTAPTVAFEFGKNSHSSLEMYMNDICTVPVNIAGLPALSMNCGFNSDGMPVGLQIIGKYFGEKEILKLGDALEKELNITEKPRMEVR